MKRGRFSEEQIIAILREQEAGQRTADVCRRHGISDATFYKWKAKYGGLEVSEAKRLKGLEYENARLKKLLAEAMLDNAMLKDIASKNGDARSEAGGRRPSACGARSERAAGVFCPGGGPVVGALPIVQAGRRGGSRTSAGALSRAATLRLPASAPAVGPRRDGDEP